MNVVSVKRLRHYDAIPVIHLYVVLGFLRLDWGSVSHIYTEDDRVCSSPGTAAHCKQSRKFFDNCESAGLRFHRETSRPWGQAQWPGLLIQRRGMYDKGRTRR